MVNCNPKKRILVIVATTLLATLEQYKNSHKFYILVLVATTLLAALEQDKGELPKNRKFRTLWTRQSRLPTVYNVYK